MSTTIARTYESYGDALAASNELQSKGFGEGAIALFSKASNVATAPAEDFATEIASAGVPADDAASLATAVNGGKTVLVVRAGFGMAVRALKAVDSHKPELGSEYYTPTFDLKSISASSASSSSSTFFLSTWLKWPLLISEAAPFSKFLNLPVLINDPAPFSRLLMWPTLTSGFTFGEPKLSPSFTFGEPKLSKDFTTGEPKLSDGFTTGEPKLSKDFTFGEPKLIDNPTVFSAKVGMPVLTKDEPEK